MEKIVDIRELQREAADMRKKEYRQKREWLEGYRSLEKMIEMDMEEIERIENRLYPSAQKLSGMPRGGAARQAGDQIIDAMEETHKLIRRIRAEIRDMRRERDAIGRAISDLPRANMRELMMRKYVHGQDWDRIAEEMHYSKSNCFKLHDAGMRALRIPAEYRRRQREAA